MQVSSTVSYIGVLAFYGIDTVVLSNILQDQYINSACARHVIQSDHKPYSFTSSKTYLEENVALLDPIEGIYDISLKREVEEKEEALGRVYERTMSDTRNFRCAIVRDGSVFKVYYEKVTEEYWKKPIMDWMEYLL